MMNVRGEKINHPALWYLVLDIDLFEYLVEKKSEFHLQQCELYKIASIIFISLTFEQRNKCFLMIVFPINQAWHMTCIRHVQNNNPQQRLISADLSGRVTLVWENTRDFYPRPDTGDTCHLARGEAGAPERAVIGTELVTSHTLCKYVQGEKSLMKVSRERKIILKFQLEW